MATDYRDFFNTRIAQEIERNIDVGRSPQYDAMQGAIQEKVAKLEELRQLRVKEEQVQAASLASQWNLNPNGVLGSAVNIGQSVYEGGASAARSLSAAGNTYLGNLKSVDATAADQKKASEQNTIAKQRLLQEIQNRKAADADPGLVSAVQNVAGAMYDNPQGSAEFIAEQLPNSAVALGTGVAGAKAGVALGALTGPFAPVAVPVLGAGGFLAGMFLGNTALETGSKAMEKAQDGGMTEAKREEAIREGAVKGGVITAVDAATLGLGGKVAKTFNKAAIEAGARAEARVLANAGVDISNLKAVESALADPILRASAKAAGNSAAKQTSGIGSKAATATTGLAMETVGEGTGEYLGELAATGKADVYDAVLEAAAGFTQSVPETAFAMKNATGNDLNAKGIGQADLTIPDPVKKTPVSNPKAKEVTADAIKTGDVSALLDEKNPAFAPEKAISALAGHSALPTTDEATKTANLEKAQKIVSDLEDQKMSNEIALRMVTPEGIQKLQTQLEEARVAGNTDAVASLEAALVDAKEDPKAAARFNNQIATLSDRINQARTNLDDFVQESQNKTLDLEVEATKITADDLVASQTTADRIINLSMATPERLSQATAEKLASDTSLSEQQRQYFRRFSDARQAETAVMGLDDVNKQIYLGGNGNEGIQTYRRDIGAALAGNDKKGALGKLKQLAGFVQDQTNKAAATQEAYDKFFATGKEYVVRSDGNRGWFIQEGQLAEKERSAEGAVNINARSKKLVNAIQVSSKALTTAQDELRAAYTNKFSTKPPQEKANVDEAAETKQAEAQGSQSTQPNATAGAGTEANAINSQADSESAGKATTAVVPETETQAAQESAAPTVEESTEGTAVGSGLTVLQGKTSDEELAPGTKLGQVYRTINKVVAFLTQRKTPVEKATDISKDRPLVSLQNFMSQWAAGDVVPSELFADELADSEIGALNNFRKMYDLWAPMVRANLKKGALPNLKGVATRDDFLFEDPIQDFFNEDGSIDENVVTAIVYGAYSWLVESMNSPALKDHDDILEMHGVKGGDVSVSPEGQAALGRMAVFKDAALTSMGRYTVDALGLTANSKADSTYMAKLTAAFGLHSLVLLVNDADLVDAVTVDGEQLNEYLPGIDLQPTGTTAKGKAVYPTLTYLRIKRDSKLVLPNISRAIKDASVQSMGVVQRVFSTEYSPNYATWKPVKFAQQRAKKTGQKISKRQRKILEKAQKVENRIIPSMWNALTVLGDNVILQAAGWTASEEARIQIENRESTLAKNLGLEDQLAGMKALVQNAIDSSPLGIAQPFFAQFEVWRNFRVGVTTRDMNLQSSKIHRFMFFRPEWQTTIKRDDEATREQFLVAVAQALGIKVDQQPNNLTIDKLNGMEQSVRDMAMNLAKAVAVPTQQLLSEADKQNIGTFAANAEGMQSLQALVAYGKFLLAEQANDPEVTVEMLVGVDGKTNGPILTHLALGAAENADGLFKQINRGGMYRDADQVKNYNHWYQRLTSLDLYEDLAYNILNGIEATPQLDAISVFTKSMIEKGKVTSAGRNLAKTPLTSFVFGSSIDKSIQNMQESFIQSVFDRIQAVADGSDKRTSTADLITGLNTLLGSKMSSNTSIEELMEKRFSKGDRMKLAQAFYDTIGFRVEETMKGYFGSFISRRNDVNKMIQGSFAFYNIIYQDLRAKELERLMDEDEVAFTQTKNGRIPLHDMTAAQEKALREKVAEVLPLAHTAYTQGTDELDAGLYMAKTRKAVSSEALNRVKVQLNKLIQNGENWRVPFITGFASETVETGPGVAGLPYFMHSLDSFIMHDSIEDSETLNVHDEAGNGVDNIVKTAQAINRSTWKGMLNFSPATEAYDMLGRSVLAMVKLAQSSTMTPEAMALLVQNMRLQLPKKIRNSTRVSELVQQVLAQAFEAQFVANKVRLESMAQMTALDQYTWEGGQYDVTPEDRLEAQEMLQKHLQQAQVSPELMAAAEALGKAFESVKATTETVAEPEADNTEQVFGPKGKSRIASDPNLVNFFSRNPKATAGQVIKMLAAQGNLSPINRKILQLVSRVVDSALPIEYVTSKTSPDSVLEAPQGPSRGWYVAKGTQEAIYVLSPDFVASGLTAETLLHELVHAAIAMTIDSPSAAAKELVAELEALRVLAKEYAEANGLTQFGPALKNVQEFVAWGMSNMPFQRDVLNKIQMQSKTKGNALVTGMQKFISTLSQLLFRKPDENIDKGLTVLISNVSGLANAAAQSKKQGGNLNLSQENTEAVDRYSTQDIYDALDTGAVSPAFSDHLKNMLSGIVESLHGPFGSFKEAMRKDEAKDPLDVWLKAVASGKAPFASSIITSNFAGSSQEHFVMEQVEATVKAALESNEASTTLLYRELYKLYNEALNKLKPSDFESQEDYDFVFDVQSDKNGRSDYLARFAALGLASEKFNKLLRFDTEVDLRALGAGNTLFERLVNVYEKILAFFAQKMTSVYGGQQADAKLESLVSQLVDIEAKKRAALTAPKGWAGDAIDMIEGRVKEASDVVREKVAKALASDMVKNNSNAAVRATGTMLRTLSMGQSDAVMHNLRKLRDTMYKDRDDILVGILNDVKGPLAQFNALLRGVKHHEQQRKQLITKHTSVTMKMFKNAGKNLSLVQRKAITNVLMRSGAHKLDGFFTLPELEKLLRFPGQLDQAIAKLQGQLGSAIKAQHIYQAESLGIYKATGQNVSRVLMLNGHLITRMLGTQYSNRITETEAQKEEPIVSALVALYAIKHSTTEARMATADALATENSRTDGNGVSFLLNMHKEMEQDSLERLFKGNPILMEHGYVPDVVNPHTKVIAANASDGVDLVAQGYKNGAKVYTDPALPGGEPRQLYVQRDGGLAPWLSGIFSLTSMKAKGSAISDGFMNVNTVAGLENAQLHATVTNAKLAQLQTVSGSNPDLMKAKKGQLAPVYNEKGEIVQWRYLMESSTKDNLLERENRFDLLVGVLAGSIFDKVGSQEWNATAVTALRQQYELEGNINSEMYVEIGAKSSDPEMRELWAMLPDATKRTIRTVWGRDGLKIRRDSMDLFFGYRKLSAADFLRKERAVLDGVQKIMREFFHLYAKTRGMTDHEADNYAKRIGVALAKGERGWQEVAREVKDIIVVKTGVVLAGNIYSNDSMLFAKGVKNRWHHQLVAFRGILAYQADSDRLFELENQLEFGQTNGQEKQMRLEVARLKDAIAKNPVKPLIDAGLLPTIAEDVEEDDPYSYKTYWARKAEGAVNRIPEGVRTIGKVVYMTHDTPIYRFLSKTTQYSDFVARYALYQHLISREENSLSHEDAIQQASDTFVNYDIPMNRKLQYSDDMGFTPFIKYFFRIQRVIMDTFRENPARVLSLLALQQFMDLGPIFLESSWLAHVGNNPVRSGAFQIVDAVTELPVINGAAGLLK